MATLIWTEPAVVDLEEIGQFVSKDNPPAADRRYERSSLNRIELFTNQILVLVSAHSTTDDMHHRERHWTKLVQVFVQIQT